ncbi:MAG: STAS domain-containing protein [candidate division WOR-3 bacterium]
MPIIIDEEKVENGQDAVILHLKGELDTYSSPEFLEEFNKKIEEGVKNFVIDLSGVSFVSSSGWGALSYALKKSREHMGDLVLCNMSGQVKRVYKIMGFRAVLKSFDDLDEAVKFILRKEK